MNHPSRRVLLLVLAAIGVVSPLWPSVAEAKPIEKSVRVLYLVPKDREARKDYQGAIERCVLDLQSWYYGHLGGKTFRLNDPIVEVHHTPHEAAWYDRTVPSNNPGQKFHTWYNALVDAQQLAGVKAEDPDYTWLVYIDAPGGTGAGMTGVAILPEHDLLGLIGKAKEGTPVSRWFGGAGHELGHAFGLPHPGDQDPQAIMQFGYVAYPACYLTAPATRSLLNSPFLHAGAPANFKGRGRFLYNYAGGTFIKVEGNKWEERKPGSDTVLHFVQQGGDDTHLHLLDASRKPGAWIALPREGKGNEIRFRWQGEEWKRIYEAKE